MSVIVGESLILCRLAELRLLEEAFRLPHEVIIPDVMLADGFVDPHGYDLAASIEMGARFGRLDGEGVELAMSYQTSYPGRLSLWSWSRRRMRTRFC